MQYKTAEEKLLADYAALEAENEQLKTAYAEVVFAEPENSESVYRIDKPIELATTSVETYWYASDTYGIAKMTSEELREACGTRGGLARVAEMHGRYDGKAAYVQKKVWPYQIKALGKTFAIDFSNYNGNISLNETKIGDPSKLNTSEWFPVECEADLYELALEKLKSALLERAEKLEKEEQEAVESNAD